MDLNEQTNQQETQDVTPERLPKTYGEKKYDFIFGTVINFWVNLLSSAAFTYWVSHSTSKIKLPFSPEAKAPSEYQKEMADWLSETAALKGINNQQERHERAYSMVNLFTLLMPGNVIMIPSVWLGAKFKKPIVEYFDRQHYDDATLHSDEIQARHDVVETEERPTLFGAIVGRLGTIGATQTVARFIGSEGNFISKFGKKQGIGMLEKFPGVDPLADKIGITIGDGIHSLAPETVENINENFAKRGYHWSPQQQKAATETGAPLTGRYDKTVQNFLRYMTADTVYTFVTSNTIHPFLNLVKKFIPGMTYKPTLAPRVAMSLAPESMAVETTAPASQTEQPSARITQPQHVALLSTEPLAVGVSV